MLQDAADGTEILMELASELAQLVKPSENDPSGDELSSLVSQFSDAAWLDRR